MAQATDQCPAETVTYGWPTMQVFKCQLKNGHGKIVVEDGESFTQDIWDHADISEMTYWVDGPPNV
jgi:hypothetical protein